MLSQKELISMEMRQILRRSVLQPPEPDTSKYDLKFNHPLQEEIIDRCGVDHPLFIAYTTGVKDDYTDDDFREMIQRRFSDISNSVEVILSEINLRLK